jgi:hypothetical protein
MIMEYCDFNYNGTVDACEIHDCIVDCENAWRAEYCPEGYEMLYCSTPFECVVMEGT